MFLLNGLPIIINKEIYTIIDAKESIDRVIRISRISWQKHPYVIYHFL